MWRHRWRSRGVGLTLGAEAIRILIGHEERSESHRVDLGAGAALAAGAQGSTGAWAVALGVGVRADQGGIMTKKGIAAVMAFFGRRSGQTLQEFKAEVDELSPSERSWVIAECERALAEG